MVTSKRIPYERETEEIDVKSELEKLRRHYAELQEEKRTKEEVALKKAMVAGPSKVQLRLYNEGVNKLTALKNEEEVRKAHDPFAINVRNASPSPTCDRLYEQGMMKKLLREEQEKMRISSSSNSSRRTISSSPVHNRLYEEGVAKVRARNVSAPRTGSPPSVRRSPSPNQTFSRLYNDGVRKIRSARSRSSSASRKPLSDDERRRKLLASATKRSPSIERLYEQGKAKLRSRSKTRYDTMSRERENQKKPQALSRLPPSSAACGYKVRGRSPAAGTLYSDEVLHDALRNKQEEGASDGAGSSEAKIHDQPLNFPSSVDSSEVKSNADSSQSSESC